MITAILAAAVMRAVTCENDLALSKLCNANAGEAGGLIFSHNVTTVPAVADRLLIDPGTNPTGARVYVPFPWRLAVSIQHCKLGAGVPDVGKDCRMLYGDVADYKKVRRWTPCPKIDSRSWFCGPGRSAGDGLIAGVDYQVGSTSDSPYMLPDNLDLHGCDLTHQPLSAVSRGIPCVITIRKTRH